MKKNIVTFIILTLVATPLMAQNVKLDTTKASKETGNKAEQTINPSNEMMTTIKPVVSETELKDFAKEKTDEKQIIYKDPILRLIEEDLNNSKGTENEGKYQDLLMAYSFFLKVMDDPKDPWYTEIHVFDKINALARIVDTLPEPNKEKYIKKLGENKYHFAAENKIVNIAWLTQYVKGGFGINNFEQSSIVKSKISHYKPFPKDE